MRRCGPHDGMARGFGCGRVRRAPSSIAHPAFEQEARAVAAEQEVDDLDVRAALVGETSPDQHRRRVRDRPSRVDSCGVRITGSSVSIAASTIVRSPRAGCRTASETRSRPVRGRGRARAGRSDFEQERLARRWQALEVDGRVAEPRSRDRWRRSVAGDDLADRDDARREHQAPSPEGGADREEARNRRIDPLAADVGPATLVPRDEAPLLELVERQTERASADIEQFAQLALGREASPGCPRA